MIAKRAYRGNDSVSNFRRHFNYLHTELDRLDDLTNVIGDGPRDKPASYKRNAPLIQEHRLRPECRQNSLQSMTQARNTSLPHRERQGSAPHRKTICFRD